MSNQTQQLEPRPTGAISRNSDPITSHEAADEITASGQRARQAKQVLDALQKHPNSTSAELAQAADMDRFMVARRLPELERGNFVRRGEPRKCEVTGRRAITWDVN